MITIDYKSRTPIYEQLVTRIRTLALGGVFAPGEKIPSVRQLSGELGINPNTVQRAYNTLYQQGVIDTAPGKGNFISNDMEALRLQQKKALFADLTRAVHALREAGVSCEQALEQAKKAYEEEEAR
ncbi:MAG: GntR family transcriptional regulator [Eubacteriales bacterium]|nr:GntR family transcriptional regulator [Eubacteriales bacterium]